LLENKKIIIFVIRTKGMKNLGDFIGHFTVKNDNEESLFKVYFYDKGISFDDNFLRGVIENKEVYKEFMNINSKWRDEPKDRDITMKSIMEMLDKHQKYLSDFFMAEEEVFDTKKGSHQMFLDFLNDNDKLTKITRKEFESQITDEKVGEYYVNNLKETKNKSKFYTYTSDNSGLDFYLMIVNDKIKIGFSSLDK
tara:strand:- start:2794 stop:3378 length:585 start_codon:yes stop_codon:yes gene_type:complete